MRYNKRRRDEKRMPKKMEQFFSSFFLKINSQISAYFYPPFCAESKRWFCHTNDCFNGFVLHKFNGGNR